MFPEAWQRLLFFRCCVLTVFTIIFGTPSSAVIPYYRTTTTVTKQPQRPCFRSQLALSQSLPGGFRHIKDSFDGSELKISENSKSFPQRASGGLGQPQKIPGKAWRGDWEWQGEGRLGIEFPYFHWYCSLWETIIINEKIKISCNF